MTLPILVTGATGRQGGAVARELLRRGVPIRALTRNPDSAAARALAARGATVVRGDLDDRASLMRACEGVRGVYSVQDPWLHGVPAEIRQGKQLADVAKQAGVELVVYGSVGYADRPTGVSHFESKGVIEAYTRELGVAVVAIRPVFFMDSLVARKDRRARYSLGAMRRGLRGGKVQLVCSDDIGRAAADAFESPAEPIVDLVGDELSFEEIVQTFVRVTGSPPRVVDVPFVFMRVFKHEAFVNFRWIGEAGWHFDVAAARAQRPWLQRFEPWLRGLHGNADA